MTESKNPYAVSAATNECLNEGDDRGHSKGLSSASRVRYEVLTLLTAAAALSYLSRNAVSVAESTIREELHISLRQSGWFMGTFFWSYAVLQIPGGWLAQRQGSRVAMLAFMLASTAATLFIGVAWWLWLLLIAQLIMGAAQAGLFPASCHSISHWIPLSRRTFACGILTMGMQVGAILAGMLTGPLIGKIGWRLVFVVFALPGFLWLAAFLLRFRNHPRQDPRVSPAELKLICPAEDCSKTDRTSEHDSSHRDGSGRSQMATPWVAILTAPAVWLLCGQQVCRAAGYMFFASWFPTFLQETRGFPCRVRGTCSHWYLPERCWDVWPEVRLTDWIWQRTGNLKLSRSGVGAFFLGACGILILAAWFVQSTLAAVVLLSLGAFFAAAGGTVAFSATIDLGGDHVPQVFGLMNMTGNLAAAACPILVAELFARTANWTVILLLFAVIYLIGAVCWGFVDCSQPIARDAPRQAAP